MASWDINYNPLWGGVTICLYQNETKNVENASDVVSALASLVAAAPNPVQGAAAVIAAYIQLEKGAVESADQGNGVCLFAAWAAIAAGQAELVVPSARPVPPVAPGHHLEVGWLDGAGNASWNWRDDNVDNGQWHQPFSIPTSTPRANSPLVAVSRYQEPPRGGLAGRSREHQLELARRQCRQRAVAPAVFDPHLHAAG